MLHNQSVDGSGVDVSIIAKFYGESLFDGFHHQRGESHHAGLNINCSTIFW